MPVQSVFAVRVDDARKLVQRSDERRVIVICRALIIKGVSCVSTVIIRIDENLRVASRRQNENVPKTTDEYSISRAADARACLQLSKMIAATNWTAARKFRASLSYRVAIAR